MYASSKLWLIKKVSFKKGFKWFNGWGILNMGWEFVPEGGGNKWNSFLTYCVFACIRSIKIPVSCPWCGMARLRKNPSYTKLQFRTRIITWNDFWTLLIQENTFLQWIFKQISSCNQLRNTPRGQGVHLTTVEVWALSWDVKSSYFDKLHYINNFV